MSVSERATECVNQSSDLTNAQNGIWKRISG